MPITAAQRLVIRSRRLAINENIIGLKIGIIFKARKELVGVIPNPIIVKTSKTNAKAVVASARLKAKGRVAAIATGRASLDSRMMANKTRLEHMWTSGSLRSPPEVIKSVVRRIDSTQQSIPRSRQTSLLISSSEATFSNFCSTLAKILGFPTSAALKSSGIQVKKIAATTTGADALYSVRLPIRSSAMHAEVHNFAWALRKSGYFRSVRPDGGVKMVYAAKATHADRAERVFRWHLDLTNL